MAALVATLVVGCVVIVGLAAGRGVMVIVQLRLVVMVAKRHALPRGERRHALYGHG